MKLEKFEQNPLYEVVSSEANWDYFDARNQVKNHISKECLEHSTQKGLKVSKASLAVGLLTLTLFLTRFGNIYLKSLLLCLLTFLVQRDNKKEKKKDPLLRMKSEILIRVTREEVMERIKLAKKFFLWNKTLEKIQIKKN